MAAKRKRKLKHGTKKTAQPRAKVRLHSTPWDMGADGPANKARESVVVEAIDPDVDPDTGEEKSRNPNGVKHRRYYDMLELYHKRGVISDKGFEAGKKLRAAWEETQRGGGIDWSQDRVDSTPKPDAQAAIKVDRMTEYVRIKRLIPHSDMPLLMAVICEGHSIAQLRKYRAMNIDRGKEHLRAALDHLAERIGC